MKIMNKQTVSATNKKKKKSRKKKRKKEEKNQKRHKCRKLAVMADPGSPATLTPAGEGATATETPATGVRVSVDHQLPEQVDVIDISSF